MKLLAFIIFFMPLAATAGPINHNCNPNGLLSYAKELSDPVLFWKNAIKHIDDEVENARREFRFRQVERKNDKIRDQLSANEERAAGVYIPPDSKMRTLMAEDERENVKFDREMLQSTLQWAEKCRLVAATNLQKAQSR